VLDELVVSKNMWYRRVAIIATMASIKYGLYGPTLRIAKKLLVDKEDLMHKAVGWALREVYKRDAQTCEDFLIKNYKNLPRTTLRYAIERMEEGKRKGFLKYKV
jgi:3-methyladenine DNA glycosylase AlkD